MMFGLLQWLEELLFDYPHAHPVAPWSAVLKFLRYPYALVRDFFRSQLNLRAMSLVYTTLLSIVPLLAFGFSIFKGLGIHHDLKPFIYEFFRPVGQNATELTDRVISFVDNTRGGVLGTLGLAFLLYTVISTIQKVEESLNFVWRVERPRSFGRRMSEYLSVMIVGPIVIVAAFGLIASAENTALVQKLMDIPAFGALLVGAGKVGPYVIVSALFTFMYAFIPNTRVEFVPALVGGVTAGVLWAAVGAIFTTFAVYSSRLQLVYTSFAFLVLGLIWIYVAWQIFLYGAQLSFYVQNPQYLRRGHEQIRLTGSLSEQLALNAMFLIGKSFRKGEPGWTTNRLATRLEVPSALLATVILSLEGAGLLVATEDERLVPGRDLSEIELIEIVDAARRYYRGEPAVHVRSTPGAGKLIAEIDEALRGQLEGNTLRELVESAD